MIQLRAATWTFPDGTRVGPVDLDVAAGELVLLTGPTGCGKSTVLRLAAGLLQRHGSGRATGTVRVNDADPAALLAAGRVGTLGVVAQDPDDQIVAATCDAEVAFGLESAGWPPDAIDRRVAEVLGQVGLAGFNQRDPSTLSGGQRQRLVIGASIAAGARALLLDEPLAQLDPAGAQDVLELVRSLARSGIAVLLVEHRLEQAWAYADRVALMAVGEVREAAVRDVRALDALGLRGPALADLTARIGPAPWRVSGAAPTAHADAPGPTSGDTHIRLTDVSAGYGGRRVLSPTTLRIGARERVALVGENGAGKSTLIRVIGGHLRATGTVAVGGRVVDVPQDPDLALFCETVADELAYGPTELGLPGAVVSAAASALSVTELMDRAPQALSRGQRLRVAVAAALTCRPDVLLLDEPTSGQDREQVDRMFAGLDAQLGDAALVYACHDLDVVLRHATRVIVLHEGRVVADGRPLETLIGCHLPLPPLARVCAELGVPYAAPEVLAAWLGRAP